jgi:hypothetical protein
VNANPYHNPAHAITASTADPHKARVKWMEANGVAGISTCPSGETVLTYADGRQVFGHARDLLPVHLRPK